MSGAFLPSVEVRNPLIGQARSILGLYDRHRDERELHSQVRHLALVGRSEVSSSAIVGVCDRTVHRMRHREPPEDYRPPLPDPEVSEERAAELEATAELALHLAFLIRDEDPNLLWEFLSRLDRRRLQELAVITLAAVPVDAALSDLYSWVADLPAAQGEPDGI